MVCGRQGVEAVPIDEKGRDLHGEEDPLGRPGKEKHLDKLARGIRAEDADGEPDGHPGETAEDHGEQEEKLRVPFHISQKGRALAFSCPGFGKHQEKPSPHG